MRALIYAYGTRGDVQPYLALAHALNRAGHQAVLSAPARFASLATDHGVDFVGRDDEWLAVLDDPDVRRLLSSGARRMAMTRQDRRKIRLRQQAEFARLLPKVLHDTWLAAQDGADVVVHSHEYLDQGQQIAEMLGVPSVLALLHPFFVPSWEYPSGLFKFGTRLPKVVNRLSYVPLRFLRLEPNTVRTWRTEQLGLPRRRGEFDMLHRPDGSRTTVLHGFSRHVIRPASDWPDSVHTTGFWLLPGSDGWTPPADLEGFLDAGEAPVFFGFGSLAGLDPAGIGRMVADTVRALRVRAVVSTGWGSIQLPESSHDVFVADQVPYDWLFPRTRLAVHAGSAGVVNEALAAGIPQVACPMHREQEIWADRMHELGVAPKPIVQRDLTTAGLTGAVREALGSDRMRQEATRLRALVRAEDGARTAAGVIAEASRATRAGGSARRHDPARAARRTTEGYG